MPTVTLNVSRLNGSNGFRLDGVVEYDHSGSSVSNAGDVNGDGWVDLILSAPTELARMTIMLTMLVQLYSVWKSFQL